MEVDWKNWNPQIRATLLFIVDGGRVLLIRKKRGIGAGKINGPGGKIDPGESAVEAAVRETEEELRVTALDPREAGTLHFQFVDGLSIHCTVFLANRYRGEATETEEAIPLWTPTGAIPYEEMWEDDRHWLPRALEGETFEGFFAFDDDAMLSKEIRWGAFPPEP